MGPCACTGALWDYVIHLPVPTRDRPFYALKSGSKHISGILPDVFSYISHFVCLYNFNYTGRPLRGPGIIGIIVSEITGAHSIRKNTANVGKNNRLFPQG